VIVNNKLICSGHWLWWNAVIGKVVVCGVMFCSMPFCPYSWTNHYLTDQLDIKRLVSSTASA
jgi:hypothetical protein